MTMKRMTVLMMMGLLGVFTLFQIGESQQAPALPQAPGAPAPAAGGGRGQGGGGRGAQQAAPVPAILENYKSVTAERLKNPEDSDWLSVRRTYNGWGYSPL